IDICVKDALEREWQLSTIQVDFNLPERFDLNYIDSDGSYKRPYMIHRALCGSMERFFAVLIEHTGGAFPTWLAPVQACIIPVADKFLGYCEKIEAQLKENQIRVEIDTSSDSMNKKVRRAVTHKIPNILIVGGREEETNTVTLRRYGVKEQETLAVSDLLARLKEAVARRS
ncbi:MAG: threonine--tRNA ligase, partial [Candidatus Dadabacteria bacterium]